MTSKLLSWLMADVKPSKPPFSIIAIADAVFTNSHARIATRLGPNFALVWSVSINIWVLVLIFIVPLTFISLYMIGLVGYRMLGHLARTQSQLAADLNNATKENIRLKKQNTRLRKEMEGLEDDIEELRLREEERYREGGE
jgi:hypothetical protein